MARRRIPRTPKSGIYGYTPVTSRSRLVTVAQVTSKADPGRVWTVKRNPDTEALSCDCPSWIFKPMCSRCGTWLVKNQTGGPLSCPSCGVVNVAQKDGPQRACKHVRAVMAGELAEVQPTPVLNEQVLAAARGANVELKLTSTEWARFATALVKALMDTGNLALTTSPPRPATSLIQPDLGLTGIRIIELED